MLLSSRAGAGRLPAAKPVLVQEELALGCELSCVCMTERARKHLPSVPEWWKSNCQQINVPVPVLLCFEEGNGT